MTQSHYLRKQLRKIGLVFCASLLTCVSTVLAEVNTSNPSISPYVKNSLVAKSIDYKTNKLQASVINPVVRLLSREYEFILFYELECSYCIEFAPILKRYADEANIKVLAFVLGDANKANALFANSTPIDQNTVERFFGQGAEIATPALFIWQKNNGHVYPVASGMHTYQELAVRMNELAPKMIKNELELQGRN